MKPFPLPALGQLLISSSPGSGVLYIDNMFVIDVTDTMIYWLQINKTMHTYRRNSRTDISDTYYMCCSIKDYVAIAKAQTYKGDASIVNILMHIGYPSVYASH